MKSAKRLRAVAELVESRCSPSVLDVFVVGSLSRGLADQYSDVEIELFTAEETTAAERLSFIELLGGESITHYPDRLCDGSWWSVFALGGVWVELGWQTEAAALALLGEIASGTVTDHDRLILASTYRDAIKLRMGGAMARWVAALEPYPAGLDSKIIGGILSLWDNPLAWNVKEALAKRGDRLALTQRFVVDLQRAIRVLYAINRTWERDYKWTAACLKDLKRKPRKLAERIDRVLSAEDCEEAYLVLAKIVVETLMLVPPEPGLIEKASPVVRQIVHSKLPEEAAKRQGS